MSECPGLLVFKAANRAACFLTAHLKKLMSEEKCSAEKASEMEDVITQVGALRTHVDMCLYVCVNTDICW